ncbi:MAG: hypothetical protein E6R04_05510 [Spirochaetes bacterium]|nr:MAG: hypothetical protein E6R04_05510 [Spirochaetota bacterium]
MKYDHSKFSRERKVIFREESLDDYITIPNLLKMIGDVDNQKNASIQMRHFGHIDSEMVLNTKSLETDEEWAARLREMDRKAEANRKRKEAAEKKELAELARLKAKYESGNPGKENGNE